MSSRPKRKRAWRELLERRRVRVYDASEIEITIGGVTLSSKDAASMGHVSVRNYDAPGRAIRADHPAIAKLPLPHQGSWEPIDITADIKIRRMSGAKRAPNDPRWHCVGTAEATAVPDTITGKLAP